MLKCIWANTLSCRLLHCSFANVGHAHKLWCTVSSHCSHSLHLLSASVFNIHYYYYYYYCFYYYYVLRFFKDYFRHQTLYNIQYDGWLRPLFCALGLFMIITGDLTSDTLPTVTSCNTAGKRAGKQRQSKCKLKIQVSSRTIFFAVA
jgi:hypothetical protein